MRRLSVLTAILVIPLAACNGGGGGGSAEAYCDAIRAFQELENELGSPDVAPGASFEEQMQAMRETFEPLKDRLDDLRRVAPSEIRDEVRALADAAEELLDTFLQADSMEALANPDLTSRISELQNEVQGARDAVAEFTEEECDIDLEAAG